MLSFAIVLPISQYHIYPEFPHVNASLSPFFLFQLAMIQTRHVISELERLHPGIDASIVARTTTGDQGRTWSASRIEGEPLSRANAFLWAVK